MANMGIGPQQNKPQMGAPTWGSPGSDNDDSTQQPAQPAPQAGAAPPLPSANMANPQGPMPPNPNGAGSQMGGPSTSGPANPNSGGLQNALMSRAMGASGMQQPQVQPGKFGPFGGNQNYIHSLMSRLRGGLPQAPGQQQPQGVNPSQPSGTPAQPVGV